MTKVYTVEDDRNYYPHVLSIHATRDGAEEEAERQRADDLPMARYVKVVECELKP